MKGKVRWNEGGKDDRGYRKGKKSGAERKRGLLSHLILPIRHWAPVFSNLVTMII